MAVFAASNIFARIKPSSKVKADPVDPARERRTALMVGVSDLPLNGDVFTSLNDSIRSARTLINSIGEEQVRLNAGRQRTHDRMQALMELDPNEDIGAPIAMQDILGYTDHDRAVGALESRYVDNVLTGAQLAADQPGSDNFDFFAAQADREIKNLIWAEQVENVWEEREDRSWINFLGEAVFLQGIPARNSMTQTGLMAEHGIEQGFWDNLAAGSAVREESAEFNRIMDEMSVEEFAQFAPAFAEELRSRAGFGPFTDLSLLQQLMEELVDAPPAAITNTMNGVDNVPLLGGIRMGVNTLSRSLVRTGSRRAAASSVAHALRTSADEGIEAGLDAINGRTIGDLAGPASPTSINPWGGVSRVSMAGEVGDRLDTAQRLLDELLEDGLTPTSRLNTDEMLAAQADAAARLQAQAGREVMDHNIVSTTLADGSVVDDVVATFGRKDGNGGYSAARHAARAARENGFDVDVNDPTQVFQEGDNWFFRASLPVRETGFYTSKLESNAANPLSRWFLSGTGTSDDALAGSAVVAEGARAQIQRNVVRTFERSMRQVPRRERRAMAEIWQAGNNEARWFNEAEFTELYTRQTGRAPQNTSAWDAYRTVQLFNDVDFVARNDQVFKELQTQGFQNLNLRAGGLDLTNVNARQLDNVSGRVYDVDTGEFIEMAGRELPEGYSAIRLKEPVTAPDGTVMRDLVGRVNTIQLSPLSRTQLGYRAGGHRMPQGSWFVKQAQRSGDQLTSPHAFIAGRNRGEVRLWAATMESVRDVLRRNADDVRDPAVVRQLEELLDGKTGYPSVDELLDMHENGRFNLNDAFEVVEDRALPSAYYGKGDIPIQGMYDIDEAADITWARSHGRMYTGHRGDDVLRDWTGEAAPTLDMMQVMRRSLNNISNIMSLSDYKMEAVSRFNRTYREFLQVEEGASEMDALMRGTVRPSTAVGVSESLEANRAQIKRILNTPTNFQQWADRAQREMVARIAGDNPNSWRYRASTGVANWWDDSVDGVNALRGAAFDLKLGLFNVAQFPLQISTMVAAMSLSPKASWSAATLPAFTYGRLALMNKNVIETLISRSAHQQLNMSADQFRSFLTSIRRSGFFRLGGNHALMEDLGPNAYAFTGGRLQQAREGARFFFNEAETWNRLTAAHIAWRETMDALPDMSTEAAEFQSRWLRRTDDYSINMSNASRAVWQRGLLSVPTQFWSYSARMMETMIGNRRFTPRQRIQLLVNQSVLYGSAGVPAASLAMYLNEKYGPSDPQAETSPLNTYQGFMSRGLVDHLVNWSTGMDVRVGERIGVGQLPEQIVRDFFGDGQYGDTAAAGLVGGATWSIWNDIAGDIKDVATYAMAEAGHSQMPMTRDSLLNAAQNWTGFSNAFKAYMVHRYGVYVSGSGTRIAADLPDEYAFTTLLSYQPNEAYEVGQMFDYLGKDEEFIDDVRRYIIRSRARLSEDVTQSSVLAEEMSTLSHIIPPDIMRRAQQLAGDEGVDSLAESVGRTVSRRQLEEEILETLENNNDD